MTVRRYPTKPSRGRSTGATTDGFLHGLASHVGGSRGGRSRNNVQLGQFGRNRTNIWPYPCLSSFGRQGDEGNLLELHPAVKPVALVADAILDCSARGDVVLDGFSGSGSTIIAAERVGRVCYTMEIDPIYVDTAIRRWQRYTGDAAVHAVTKTPFDSVQKKLEDHNG